MKMTTYWQWKAILLNPESPLIPIVHLKLQVEDMGHPHKIHMDPQQLLKKIRMAHPKLLQRTHMVLPKPPWKAMVHPRPHPNKAMEDPSQCHCPCQSSQDPL